MTRSEFLKATIANCHINLAKPNRVYPNGRMSHDVEREILSESQDKLYDAMLDGEFDASGNFVKFIE